MHWWNAQQRWAALEVFLCCYASELYRSLLEEKVRDIPHVWFQQDGATAHIANVSMNIIREAFAGCVISRNCDVPWPPRSPDLSPYDFFMRIPEAQSVAWRFMHYSSDRRGHSK